MTYQATRREGIAVVGNICEVEKDVSHNFQGRWSGYKKAWVTIVVSCILGE